MSLRGIGTRLDNRLSAICVAIWRNLCNLRTIEKGSQIMRACGVDARDGIDEGIYHEVEEVKEV
jgi:hypothetical protein